MFVFSFVGAPYYDISRTIVKGFLVLNTFVKQKYQWAKPVQGPQNTKDRGKSWCILKLTCEKQIVLLIKSWLSKFQYYLVIEALYEIHM